MFFIPKSTYSAVRQTDGHLRWLDARREETLSSLISKSSKRFNDLFRRNAGRGLINYLLKIAKVIHPRLSSNVVMQIVIFTRRCHFIYRHNGSKGLTLYLKACQVLLQQSVGKYHVKDLSDLKARPKRNRFGSPVLIHRSARSGIHNDYSKRLIMLWMTLFGVYRVIDFKGSLKLKSITDPFVVPDKILTEWTDFVNNDWQKVLLMKCFKSIGRPSKISLRPIGTSSPTSGIVAIIDGLKSKRVVSTHFASIWLSSLLWRQYTQGIDHLKRFSVAMGATYFVERLRMISWGEPLFKQNIRFFDNKAVFAGLTTFDKSPTLDRRIYSLDKGNTWHHVALEPLTRIPRNIMWSDSKGILGKLALKFEAAGKVRVFAMVDCWTQWVMEPLHKVLFSILRNFKTDGTFNQVSPVESLISRMQIQGVKVPKTTFYSLDLSSATDRLPITLQSPIVALVYNLVWVNKFRFGWITDASKEFAKSWVYLLVDRFYYLYLSKRDFQRIEGKKERTYKLKYSVGQPMGALSSWAMLAMTHHAIVIFCAKRAKIKDYRNFSDYAVLGDDIIIANSKVAHAYLHFLSQIGVSVGLAKSIVSKRRLVLEFAKKFFVGNTQMNMIPIKDCLTVWVSNSLVKEFAEKWKLSLSQILTFLGYGYKSKIRALERNIFDVPVRQRVNLVWLATPGSHNGRESWLKWIGMSSAFESFVEYEDSEVEEIVSILIEEVIKRHTLYWDTYYAWKQSVIALSEKGGSQIRITQDYIVSGSAMNVGHNETVEVPFAHIIRTDLSKSIDTSFSPSDTVIQSASEPYTYVKEEAFTIDAFMQDLPLDEEEFMDKWRDRVYLSSKEELRQLLEELCNFLCIGNEFDDVLQREAWPITRKVEKLFDDFNPRYKFWLLLNSAMDRPEKHWIKTITGRHNESIVTPAPNEEHCHNKNKPSQRPVEKSVDKKTVDSSEKWGLKILYLLLSYGIFFFALFILIQSSKQLSYPNSPPERAVRYVMVEAANQGSEWFSWLLIFIIVLLIGGLFYIYMLPPKIVVDKTQESILQHQVENLKSLNTELASEIQGHLSKISDLSSSQVSLVSELKEKALEISRLDNLSITQLSTIESLRSKVSAYFDSITKLRKEISDGIANSAVEKVEKLLLDSQKELEVINTKFINLATTVREHGHVPHDVELDQVWSNFNCEALTCLEQIGRTMNPSHWYETLSAYKGEIHPMTISDVDDELLRTVEILHRFFVNHSDLADFASDIIL
jgi:hypothetical protein